MDVADSFPPALHVTTRRVDDLGDLLEWLEPRHPIAFLRGGDGIVGYGGRHEIVTTAGDRVPFIAERWRALCETATVDDEVRMPGSGLVAFGSFAFSDRSAAASVLTVPEIVLGRRNGVSWITRVSDQLEPVRYPVPPAYAVQLTPGAMSPDGYLAAVASALEHIADGDASKIVIARDLVGRIPKMADLRPVIARLARAYPDTSTFAVQGLIGSSPETLVRVQGGVVTARVLAGSAARGVDAGDDVVASAQLLGSAKDLGEHAFAVDSLLGTLAPHASAITTDGPFPLALPNLWHLATDVSGILTDGSSALDLVAALHPTAAVAGSPTSAAQLLIDELEPFDRGRYAGPVGWVDSHGDGEWAVALRCAQFTEDDEVTAYAGAGIVAASVPAQELAETELKFRPIVEALS